LLFSLFLEKDKQTNKKTTTKKKRKEKKAHLITNPLMCVCVWLVTCLETSGKPEANTMSLLN